MRRREDIRLGLRWVLGRPVETLLLVFGISLGIGATAAGIALAGHTAATTRQTLASTEYREIVVSTRQNSTDMDLPAVARTTTQNVVLTTADLSARTDAQDVQYAYVANRMDMRLGAFQMPDGGAAPDGAAPPDGMAPPDGFVPPDDVAPQAATPEGPQPALEEIQGFEVSPDFFGAWGMRAAEGSIFTTSDMQKGEPLLVLGSTLAGTLYEDGKALGRQVLSRRKLYTIAGILEPTGTSYDTMAYTPAAMVELQGNQAAARMFMRFDTTLHFTVADAARLDQASAQLSSWFEQKYGQSSVVLTVPRAAAEAARDRSGRLLTVILFLAFSALLIAAANVTTILGSRAMRKRRAVGVLKALGATTRSVFGLFIIEALIIGAAGAALGTGFSSVISWLMQSTMGFGGVLAGLLAAGILGAAVLVTALDILPAMQAARVPAAEAIRYE
jgi:hypothetical protein